MPRQRVGLKRDIVVGDVDEIRATVGSHTGGEVTRLSIRVGAAQLHQLNTGTPANFLGVVGAALVKHNDKYQSAPQRG